jgi:hypothetical protein
MWSAAWLALLLPLLGQSQNCAIEGRVSNLLRGGPVRKAKVLMGTQGNPKYQAVTDANGHYTIAGVPAGRYVLWVQRPGYLPSYYGAQAPNRPGKTLLLNAGDNRKDVNFNLEPPGVITGHIYDQDGEPLSTVVQVFREIWSGGHKRIQQAGGANSDDEGLYRVFGLQAGSYIVATAQSPVRPASPVPTRDVYPVTFYPSTEDATGALVLKLAPGGEARDIDLHIRKTVGVTVSGSLAYLSPDPATRLTLSRADGFPISAQNLMFPQPGQFSAKSVTPGSYILSARSTTDYARMTVDVGTLDIDGLQLRMAAIPEIAGTLKFEGDEPPDGTTVALTLATGELTEPPSQALVDKAGHVSWKGLTPGKWTLDFAPKLPGLFLKSSHEIEIGPDGHAPIEVTISTQGASVQGKVQVSAENTAPVEAATVLIFPENKNAENEKQPRVLESAVTGSDGVYTLSRIPPGKYRLLALEDIETNSWDNPDVARRFEGKGLAIELGPSEKAAHDLPVSQP